MFKSSQLAKEDHPIYKCLEQGNSSLTDSELLSILIGGNVISSLNISRDIYNACNQNLINLSKLMYKDVASIKGITKTRFVALQAALELGKRFYRTESAKKDKITQSKDIYVAMRDIVHFEHEVFWVMFLNRSNKIIAKEQISSGGVSGTVVDFKMIFKRAVYHLASNLIFCHNHPSGSLTPSQMDIGLTKKGKSIAELFDINILDHLIISNEGYFSFADEGVL